MVSTNSPHQHVQLLTLKTALSHKKRTYELVHLGVLFCVNRDNHQRETRPRPQSNSNIINITYGNKKPFQPCT